MNRMEVYVTNLIFVKAIDYEDNLQFIVTVLSNLITLIEVVVTLLCNDVCGQRAAKFNLLYFFSTLLLENNFILFGGMRGC